jgi:AcrR family transcriptional regulator
MLQLVSLQGYEASTVADVISRIGMSRKTFYEQFEDRRGCFLWVCEQVASRWQERGEEAIAEASPGRERTTALLQTLFEQAVEQPGALRSVMLEAAVVRPGGLALRERAIAGWAAMLADSLHTERTSRRLSPELTSAIFGGIVRTLHSRLPPGVKPRAPRRAQLMDLVPQLVEWVSTYAEHPPRSRENGARGDGASTALLLGGRAPGTLALSSRSNERRGLPRGENQISRSFVVHSQRERILDAVANLAAAKGYANLTIPEIVQEAAVSVQAFYEHFSGKEDAFLVAYAVGHRRALVAFERAFESQEDWPNAIHTGLQALFGFFAAEPSFAHCALVDAPSASERAAVLLSQGIAAYVQILERGYDELGANQAPPPPIATKAIACALHELCFAYVVRERARELSDLVPEATFLVLAPFLGGEAAAQIAGLSEQEKLNGAAKRAPRGSRARLRQS